jgi:nucleoside-diphosphate-sugar epimerase
MTDAHAGRTGSEPVTPDRPTGVTLLVGCGRVAIRLGRRLVARGGQVIALRRRVDDVPAGIRVLAHDLDEPFPAALPAVDSMVITLPPGREGSAGYRTRLHHVAAALPAVPSRTVFVSSTGVFERKGAGVVDESDEPHPTSPRGRELWAGERTAQELFSAVVVRPAGIYGPGREHLVRQVREGAEVDYSRRTNRIHEADLARTLDRVLTMADPPALLHAVDSAPALLGDVVAFIADELGLAHPPRAAARGEGIELDGRLLRSVVGELEFPDYRSGYRDLLAGGS